MLVTVPQFKPVQALPLIVQLTVWLDPVQSLAEKLCCAPRARLAEVGEREIAGLHVCAAVIVIAAEAAFEGSATLVATSVTVGAAGTVAGAV